MRTPRMFVTAIIFALLSVLYLAQSWANPLGSESGVRGAVWAAPTLSRSAKPADIDCNAQVEIPEAECNALVTLYNSTNGPGWTDNSDWLVTDTPCSWYGVTCADGFVQGLALNANNLVGTIPLALADLTQLQNLYLYTNKLTGSIPPELGSLSLLAVLYLSDNQLSGAIPSQLGNLANLQLLYLNSNELTGSLPAQLGNLAQITAIDMDVNQLSGPIPSTFGNLTNLTSLSLSTNQLSGPIPAELGQLSNLQRLILPTNQLTGSIPPELGDLAQLQWLYLSDNKLSGPIPVELSNLANLQYLYLNNTSIDGALPPELGALTQLLGLDISSTWLSGALPQELTNLPLDWFSFYYTNLCVPDDVAVQNWLATISTLLGVDTSCSETPPPPLEPATLPDGVPVTIQVSPSQAPAGSTIAVSGKGAAGSNQVRLMAVVERQTIGIQEVDLDDGGSYSVQIPVGASYEPGIIQLCALALGLANAEIACVDFTVQSPATGSIEGEVRFPAGRIARMDQLNAEFRLLDAAGGTRYTSEITPSNDGGKFSIDKVEPGLYLYGVIGVLPGYVEMGTVEIKPLKPSILPLAVVEQCGIVAQRKPTSVVTANPSRVGFARTQNTQFLLPSYVPEQLPFGQYIKGVRNDVTFTASPQATGPVQKVIFEFVGLNSQTLARFEDSSAPFQVQYNVGDLPISAFGKHPSLYVTPVVNGVEQCPSLFDIEVIPDPMTSSDFLQPVPYSRTWWDAGIQSYRFQANIPYIEGVLPADYSLGTIPFLGEINNKFNTGINVNGTLNLEGKARLYLVQAFADAVVLGYPVLPEGDGGQDLTPPGISNVEFDYRNPSQIAVPFKVTLVDEPLITIGATKVLVFTYFGIVNAYINGQLVFGVGVYLEGQVQPLVPAVDLTMTGSGSLAAELGLSADLLFGLVEGGAGIGGAVCINIPLYIVVSAEPDVRFLSPTVGGKLYIVAWASAFWGLYKTRTTTTIANFGAGCGGLVQRASGHEDELIPPEFFVAPVVAASPGGRILSAYVENTAPPGETEKVQIMARFQEPGSTVWSAPQAISNPAHSAQAPAVAFVGPNQIPVVAWAEITLTAAEAAALGEDINGHTKYLEIFYALWQDDGWGQPIALTSNLLGEGLPELAGTSNGGVLAWTRDLDGDIATRTDQRIAVSLFNLGTKTFDAPDVLSASASGLNNDVSVAYDTNGPTPIPYVAWVYDVDGDLLTADDRRLALAYRDGVNWVLLNPQPLPPRVDSPAITVTPNGVEVAFLVREASPDGSVGVLGVNGVLWRAKLVAGKWTANPLLDERGKTIYAEQPVIQSLQDETLLVFRRFDNSTLVTNLGQISLSRIVANNPPSSPLYVTNLPGQKWSASVAINPITNEAIIVNSSVSLLPKEAEAASLDGIAATQTIAATDVVQLGSATNVVEARAISVGADPALDPLEASSQAPSPQSPVIIAATVRNVGRGTASNTSVSLYLGTSASGTLLGTQAVSGTLGFNEIQTLYFTVAPQKGEFSLFAQLSSGGQNLSTANDSAAKTLGTLSAPSHVNASASMEFENGLILAWSGNPGEYISGYRILRSSLPNGPWELVGEAAGPNFTDTLVERGENYCYAIQAYNANTLSPQGPSSCTELPLLPLYLPKVKR